MGGRCEVSHFGMCRAGVLMTSCFSLKLVMVLQGTKTPYIWICSSDVKREWEIKYYILGKRFSNRVVCHVPTQISQQYISCRIC